MTKTLEPGFTPHAVRRKWDALKLRIESFLEKSVQNLSFGLAAIAALTVLNYFIVFGSPDLRENINFIAFSSIQVFFLGLCIWGPIGLLLQHRHFSHVRGYLMVLGLCIHVVSVVFLFGWRAPLTDKVLQILVMLLQPCLAYVLCALSAYLPAWSAWLTSILIAGISYWIFFASAPVSAIAWISLRANPARYVMFITFYALQFHYLKTRFKNHEQGLSYFFSPAQSLLPLPLALEGFQQQATLRTFAQGLTNLGFATIALGLYLLLGWIGLPTHGFGAANLGYIHHFFYLFFLISFCVGLLQWCGFPVPQPCDFALLSASPHLRWRRWNRYTYKWLSLTVFFPLLRRTGSRLLALMISFLCVGLLHLNALLFIAVPAATDGGLRILVVKLFCYYLGHATAIWAGFLLPVSWTDERRLSSWAGVALTWIMVACIFSLYY